MYSTSANGYLRHFFVTDQPIWNLLGVAIAVGVVLIIHTVVVLILRRIHLRRASLFVNAVAHKLPAPTRLLAVIITLTASVPFLQLEQPTEDRMQHALLILNIVGVAWTLIRAVAVARQVVVGKYNIQVANNLMARRVHTQFEVIENILIVLIIVLAIGIGLMTFEQIRQVGMSLLASAGIAGVILGLAAQRMIGTILAGLQIALTQPIRIDDVVIVEGEFGRVQEINLTYVVVSVWDQRRIIVPTTYFIEKPFQNWTHTSSELLGTVFIFTSYNVPLENLKQELDRLLEGNGLWDKRAKAVQITDIKPDGIVEVRALVSADNSSKLFDLRVYVREKLLAYLQENYPESLPVTRVEFARPPASAEATIN